MNADLKLNWYLDITTVFHLILSNRIISYKIDCAFMNILNEIAWNPFTYPVRRGNIYPKVVVSV